MSTIAAWSYVATLTVWPLSGRDSYGQPTYGTPYTLQGDWAAGGDTQAEANGDQFTPMSTYWFQLADGSALLPERGSFIMRGDLTATVDPIDAGAEKIRKVVGWEMTKFGAGELPDWAVYT